MKSLLLVFSVLVMTAKTLEYQPQVDFQQDDVAYQLKLGKNVKLGTQIIKGNNGKMYEVTIYPSKKLYETHVESTEQLQTAVIQPYLPAIDFTSNFGLNRNIQQQQFNNLQPNCYESSAGLQNHDNQFTANTNYQQQQTQDRQQADLISQRTANQQTADSFIQNAHAPLQLQQSQIAQQHQQQNYLQQHNKNLQNDLNNNQKYYVSQSEASQLNVPYKHFNNNPRPFLRVITKCDASGQCESQNVSNSGVAGSNDFKHQQVLQQSRAHIQLSADESQQKLNYQFAGNALTSNAAKALRGIPISKGTDLKNRRLFHYCEFAIPQYPHN